MPASSGELSLTISRCIDHNLTELYKVVCVFVGCETHSTCRYKLVERFYALHGFAEGERGSLFKMKRTFIVMMVAAAFVLGFSAFALGDEVLLTENFDDGDLDPGMWNVRIVYLNADKEDKTWDGDPAYVTFQDDGQGGKRIVLRAYATEPADDPGVTMTLFTVEHYSNNYVLEFDMSVPFDGIGAYATTVFQQHPDSYPYWWLELHADNVFRVFTMHEGEWDCRFHSTPMFFAGILYKIKVENRPDKVRVTIMAEDGFVFAQSDWVPHDTGDPSYIAFTAMGAGGNVRGAIYDNIRLYVPDEW